MCVKIKHFVVFVTIVCFFSCQQKLKTSKITGEKININDSVSEVAAVDTYVAPYRLHINKILDSTLAYNPKAITKTDSPLNTAIGNLMADIVYDAANPIFKKRTGKTIDLVLLNHGGIRAPMPKGAINARTAYQVMPFENTIVVAELSGEKVYELIDYLVKRKRAHPISKLKLILNPDYTLNNATIKGVPIVKNRTYHVATSNYLLTGGDNMDFFLNPIRVTETDYLIRNAMIDYFEKVDTIIAKHDDRFSIKQ
ncbi:5'-nucleotidase [Leptobacterium sp. I13]|uniref:5'-nucleotidase n=1 Tax=Leptobacterium meishanense TaxID=3128904 RepID=UPI0030EB788B